MQHLSPLSAEEENEHRREMEADKDQPEGVCPGKKLRAETVREKLAQATGPRYWRTLEELTQAEGFEELLHREFPRGASEWLDPVTRRGFLQLMGASLALAGLALAATRWRSFP